MPNTKAAAKWARASAKRTNRNAAVKTKLKTLFKRATADSSTAEQRSAAASAFDKAAARGIIHPNKAARKKSRLAKHPK